MTAEFRARLDLSNKSVAIVDRDGDPILTYASHVSVSTVTSVLEENGWTSMSEPWRHTSPPDGFEFDVTRTRKRWTAFAGWCRGGHQVRETFLDTDAPSKLTSSSRCISCGRPATLDLLPVSEPVDGPVTEYGVFDLSVTDRGEEGDLTGPLCVERRHVNRFSAYSRAGLYGNGIVAVVCPLHADVMAGWCPFCPAAEVAARPHVMMQGERDGFVTVTVSS